MIRFKVIQVEHNKSTSKKKPFDLVLKLYNEL